MSNLKSSLFSCFCHRLKDDHRVSSRYSLCFLNFTTDSLWSKFSSPFQLICFVRKEGVTTGRCFVSNIACKFYLLLVKQPLLGTISWQRQASPSHQNLTVPNDSHPPNTLMQSQMVHNYLSHHHETQSQDWKKRTKPAPDSHFVWRLDFNKRSNFIYLY